MPSFLYEIFLLIKKSENINISKIINFNDRLNNFTIVLLSIFKIVLIVNNNSSCLFNKEPMIKTHAQIKYDQKIMLMINVNISLKQGSKKNYSIFSSVWTCPCRKFPFLSSNCFRKS